jgi:DNA-directed RNA polymerase subunit RPC12/RpoP
MEVPAERLQAVVRCSKCHSSLRTPKSIRQNCPYCGGSSDFGVDASGRRVKCRECGGRLQIPVQVARPKRRRHRRGSGSYARPEASLIPLIISLGVSIIGLMLCFRLLANL